MTESRSGHAGLALSPDTSSALRYAAFPTESGGGNPAGVVLDAAAMSAAEMLRIAAEIGYSETAFLEAIGSRDYRVRYFSPQAEVDFCGHATVAAAVALADAELGAGELVLHSNVGEIRVSVASVGERYRATLTTVSPKTAELPAGPLAELLAALDWEAEDLDPDLPIGLAFGGLWHPILWAVTRERLAELEYDFAALTTLMQREGWGTVSLLTRERADLIHSRNAFPIGGVVEDPATGAAAAALGGFLRTNGLLPDGGKFRVLQGEDMGQPCLLDVDASGHGGIRVSGTATRIVADAE
ncbi:PhzF family phenazine biosynthesis protein [Leucobacter aridicollis]|uniref:PhzF family phenazine biosynthesis protein n=1 Tax=Leucobacter aridicollis TaxID=283878 RepID=UPI0021054C03|nr:PhzF family phenazine biosynthesis isomerase [Leucobacter aridicollis]UTX51908.1 PhzF family phenazine biosynthesis isomerase [Leucobacter aridicollis]